MVRLIRNGVKVNADGASGPNKCGNDRGDHENTQEKQTAETCGLGLLHPDTSESGVSKIFEIVQENS